jgi:hypothetical protein
VDLGITESLKIGYRKKFVWVLSEKLENTQHGNGLVQAIKTLNIKKVIYMIAEAWN